MRNGSPLSKEVYGRRSVPPGFFGKFADQSAFGAFAYLYVPAGQGIFVSASFSLHEKFCAANNNCGTSDTANVFPVRETPIIP